jgi:anti-anti-sigma factor
VSEMLSGSFSPYPSGDEAGPGSLGINIAAPDEDTLVVTPSGEADFYTVPGLWEVLVEATSAGRTRLVVDLDHLTFMDASALGVLVDARLRLAESGGTLQVRCRSRLGQRVLALAGLDGLIDHDA